jgi:expansin (peptidoglycan-binding protein)
VTSQGFKTVVVRITDKCPDGYCGMDLGGSAPAAVMVDGIGRYQGAWRAVSCAGHPEVSDGVPSLHVKDGSNPGWSAIQIRNPVMAVAGIDYQDVNNGAIGGSMGLAPGIENYYLVPTDALAGTTLKLTVHYVDGSTATVTVTAAQLGMPDTTYPLN